MALERSLHANEGNMLKHEHAGRSLFIRPETVSAHCSAVKLFLSSDLTR